mmetsp:Transcript_17100/g.39156  ORF Transcript_17100/g.39156 Transcript_17100/m.39156 type:complete len:388 (-) Transcript_17100:110-1273(-)
MARPGRPLVPRSPSGHARGRVAEGVPRCAMPIAEHGSAVANVCFDIFIVAAAASAAAATAFMLHGERVVAGLLRFDVRAQGGLQVRRVGQGVRADALRDFWLHPAQQSRGPAPDPSGRAAAWRGAAQAAGAARLQEGGGAYEARGRTGQAGGAARRRGGGAARHGGGRHAPAVATGRAARASSQSRQACASHERRRLPLRGRAQAAAALGDAREGGGSHRTAAIRAGWQCRRSASSGGSVPQAQASRPLAAAAMRVQDTAHQARVAQNARRAVARSHRVRRRRRLLGAAGAWSAVPIERGRAPLGRELRRAAARVHLELLVRTTRRVSGCLPVAHSLHTSRRQRRLLLEARRGGGGAAAPPPRYTPCRRAASPRRQRRVGRRREEAA